MNIFKTTIEIWSHDCLADEEIEDVIIQSIGGNCRGIEQSVELVEFTPEMQKWFEEGGERPASVA